MNNLRYKSANDSVIKSTANDNFIKQTAEDYCMSDEQVKSIYNKWNAVGMFYEKLEEFISQR